jgi:hypothetical protein
MNSCPNLPLCPTLYHEKDRCAVSTVLHSSGVAHTSIERRTPLQQPLLELFVGYGRIYMGGRPGLFMALKSRAVFDVQWQPQRVCLERQRTQGRARAPQRAHTAPPALASGATARPCAGQLGRGTSATPARYTPTVLRTAALGAVYCFSVSRFRFTGSTGFRISDFELGGIEGGVVCIVYRE